MSVKYKGQIVDILDRLDKLEARTQTYDPETCQIIQLGSGLSKENFPSTSFWKPMLFIVFLTMGALPYFLYRFR